MEKSVRFVVIGQVSKIELECMFQKQKAPNNPSFNLKEIQPPCALFEYLWHRSITQHVYEFSR